MSTRKSANRANTDSPVSTASVDSTSTRSTTRSSLQITTTTTGGVGSEQDINTVADSSIQESKRPRRTNVRTPTTPTSTSSSSSSKKKSEEIDENSSIIGTDIEDDKSVKSLAEEIKSEDDKKTESLTESPVRAARKRKVFDKTAIVTRKSAAMDLANNTKRILRCDRRNSTGKFESFENETKKRSMKKTLSSTPEPPSSNTLKRKRINSIRPDEEHKRIEKMIKIETVESVEESQRGDDDGCKDNELPDIEGIKQDVEDATTDVPLTGLISKKSEEEKITAFVKKEVDNIDEEKSEGDEMQIENNLEEGAETPSTSNGKKVLSKNENKVEVVPDKPRRGRPKKTDSIASPSPVKKLNRRGAVCANKDPEKKTKAPSKRIAQKLSLTEPNDPVENSDSEKTDVTNIEINSENIACEEEEDVLLDVNNPLEVDTTSCVITDLENESPSTSSDKVSGKAASLSPELISEGINVMSVKQFYKKPEFLENNLGIEKDPKLGEIVQEVEKNKEEFSNNSEGVNEILVTTNETVSLVETNPNCSGDSLKEEERLVLDMSTEDETSRSTVKFGNDDVSEITATEVVLEEQVVTQPEVEESGNQEKEQNIESNGYEEEEEEEEEGKNEEEKSESNNESVETVLEIICDNSSKNTAVVVDIDKKENSENESDIEIKDKNECNKDSVENMQDEESCNDQNLKEENDLEMMNVNKKTEEGFTEEQIKDINRSSFKTIDLSSEVLLKTEENYSDSDSSHDGSDKTDDLKINIEECVPMDEDESKDNEENFSITEDKKDSEGIFQSIDNSPKTIENEDDETTLDKTEKNLLETPETLKQKENHLKNLGLLTHKAAVEAKIEKQRRRKLLQHNLLGNGGGGGGGGGGGNKKNNNNNANDSDTGSNASTNDSGGSNGSATITAGNCNKDSSQEYTGTLKTVIKLNRQASNGSGSSSSNNESKRNKAVTNSNSITAGNNNNGNNSGRQPLKITFQKGRGRGGNSSDKDQTNSTNSGDDTYYTIQNEVKKKTQL